jgi:arabinan endo-1,5-alpha-L-arabinosidase
MKISLRQILSSLLVIALFNACQPVAPELETRAPAFTGTMLEPQGFIQRTHDPVIAHEGDTYYVVSTGSHIPFLCSKDKVNWEFCGRVFKKDPAWIREINPNLWIKPPPLRSAFSS